MRGLARGRCRLSLRFSDGSTNEVHYSVLPPLTTQIARVGTHWAEDAWLPLEYPDPFGRVSIPAHRSLADNLTSLVFPVKQSHLDLLANSSQDLSSLL